MLFVVVSSLLVSRCLLFVAYCSLLAFVVCCSLWHVVCLLFVVRWCSLVVVGWLFFVSYGVRCVLCVAVLRCL